MTLTTHAVVGATVACLIPEHAVLGFSLAFVSHFLLDAIPHWDYELRSKIDDETDPLKGDMIINRDFFIDLARIGIDVLCGLSLVFFLFTMSGPRIFWIPFIGVAGALLPDALQFLYFKWKHQPLMSLQRFHLWVHAFDHFNDKPLIGIPFQILIILVAISIAR